jgi:hypothetical protein
MTSERSLSLSGIPRGNTDFTMRFPNRNPRSVSLMVFPSSILFPPDGQALSVSEAV